MRLIQVLSLIDIYWNLPTIGNGEAEGIECKLLQ